MYNSAYSLRVPPKVANQDRDNEDLIKVEDTQTLINNLTFGGTRADNVGLVGVTPDMWDKTRAAWASGQFPSVDDLLPGRTARNTHAGFKKRVASMPALVTTGQIETEASDRGLSGAELEAYIANHPTRTGVAKTFANIKHFESGRHFDIDLSYVPDGTDSFRLKAKVKTRSGQNVHGDHVFDVASGKWHPESDVTATYDGYNPIDVLTEAPEDFHDVVGTAWKLPHPTLASCKTCHRSPKFLRKMLELLDPRKCTTCGKVGRLPEYDYESGSWEGNRETSAFSQWRGRICANDKCANKGKNVATEPAYVDTENFDIILPGEQGRQERRQYILTPEKIRHINEMLRPRTIEKIDQAVALMKDAKFLGDATENGDLDAAKKAWRDGHKQLAEINHALNNHRLVAKYEEGKDLSEDYLPFETVYDNDEFASRINGNNVRAVQLPIQFPVCDHQECDSYGQPIAVKNDKRPDTKPVCQHCMRSSDDGVDVAQRPDGYSRCNPMTYGANTCAPMPDRITDPKTYFGFLTPDPDNKLPVAKRLKKGLAIMFGRTRQERDRMSPYGPYPGMQATLVKRPGGSVENKINGEYVSVNHGFERASDYMRYGPESGHAPFVYLGTAGRNFDSDVYRVDPSNPYDADEIISRARDEKITPDLFKLLTATPVIDGGDKLEAEHDLGGDASYSFNAPGSTVEETPGITFGPKGLTAADIAQDQPDLYKPEPAIDSKGNIIAPGLDQDTWDIFTGRKNREISTVGQIMDYIRGKTGGGDLPINHRPKRKKRSFKISSIDNGDLSYAIEDFSDPNDPELRQLKYMPALNGEDPSFVFRDDSVLLPQKPETTADCGYCGSFSKYNEPENAVFNDSKPHCGECRDPRCRGARGKKAHCSSCSQSEKCKGRERWWYKFKGFKCPACLNTGKVKFNRQHCVSCKNNECKGPDNPQTSHCTGCSEHAKEQAGQDHDTTRGLHARFPDEIPTEFLDPELGISGKGTTQAKERTLDEVVGEAPEASKVINERFKKKLFDPEAEGVSPTEESMAYGQDVAREIRAEDLAEGYVAPLPEEQDLATLNQYGPTALFNSGIKLKTVDSKDVQQALESDIQNDLMERSTYSPVQQARFDDPYIIELRNNVAEMVENNYNDDDDQPVVESETPVLDGVIDERVNRRSFTTTPVIEHDINCKKCNRGIIKFDQVSPEEMASINRSIEDGTARINSQTKNELERRKLISQLTADAYKCKG